MRYGRASFLLAWNGTSGAYFFNPQTAADPWQEAWTADVGHPVAARYRVGAGWRRDYSGGTVLLDPSASHPQTFDLGRPYRIPGGAIVQTVTLAPTTALILMNVGTPSTAPATAPAKPAAATGILWDAKRFGTRKAFAAWLRSHHIAWKTWARNHPAAALRLH
jgi:hypothetical protein